MADISKCNGEGCPWKETCWRYLAPSNEYWQAYITTPGYWITSVPGDIGVVSGEVMKFVCDMYWPIEEED